MSKAEQLFRSFHERGPSQTEITVLDQDKPHECLEVGELVGVMYKVKGTKEPYLHRFTAGRRPKLFVSDDGRQMFVLNGKYRFTARGFIG